MKIIIFILGLVFAGYVFAGRHAVSIDVLEVYEVEHHENSVTIYGNLKLNRPLKASKETMEKVHCFPDGFQNMITQKDGATIVLKFLDGENYNQIMKGASFSLGCHSDTIIFKNGELHEVHCSGRIYPLRESRKKANKSQ